MEGHTETQLTGSSNSGYCIKGATRKYCQILLLSIMLLSAVVILDCIIFGPSPLAHVVELVAWSLPRSWRQLSGRVTAGSGAQLNRPPQLCISLFQSHCLMCDRSRCGGSHLICCSLWSSLGLGTTRSIKWSHCSTKPTNCIPKWIIHLSYFTFCLAIWPIIWLPW